MIDLHVVGCCHSDRASSRMQVLDLTSLAAIHAHHALWREFRENTWGLLSPLVADRTMPLLHVCESESLRV